MKTLLPLLLLLVAGCSTTPRQFEVISKTHNAYRCAQPDRATFDSLKKAGVQWDIKLNTDSEGSDAYAESIGIHVIKIPIDFWHQLLGPVPVDRMIEAIEAHPDNFVVHCTHGQDRTGLYVYLYDRTMLRMSKQDAEKDMLAHGFHRILFGLWEAEEDN